jgi:tRNA pseudouridine38-40 synthase
MMAERTIKLTIEYDGSHYAGWQSQENAVTIQSAIGEAIHAVTGQSIHLTGAGRTDSGVHALGQVANFTVDHPLEAARFADAINFHLTDDIRILNSEEVPLGFNARRDAAWRRYRYLMSNRRSALCRKLRWEHHYQVDEGLLNMAAEMILGEHNFAPFCVVASRKEDNRCTVFHSKWRLIGTLWVYEIRGNRFLHSMVRSLVGAMVNVATVNRDRNSLNLTLADIGSMLSGSSNERNPFTAPAHGLYLVSVGYNDVGKMP